MTYLMIIIDSIADPEKPYMAMLCSMADEHFSRIEYRSSALCDVRDYCKNVNSEYGTMVIDTLAW